MESSPGPGGSLRIDWFDGSVSERPHGEPAPAAPPSPPSAAPASRERKLMGFRRLAELADSEPSAVILVLSGRTSFWDLLEIELKPDFIVLIAKVLARLCDGSRVLAQPLLLRALDSSYLTTLTNYMLELPATRISEKRFNAQFWWDVEGLFTSVARVCRGAARLCPERAGAAATALTAARASLSGLADEHRETFSDELVTLLGDVARELELAENNPSANAAGPARCAADGFRGASVLPGHADLTGAAAVPAAWNRVRGAYRDADEYLAVQFALMREDYVAPLREGIMQYLQDSTKSQYDNIRVHTGVSLVRPHVSSGRVGYLVTLPRDAPRPAPRHFMFGSLLLLTADSFASMLCATVLDCSATLLRNGFLVVSLDGAAPPDLYRREYVMVASEVYFEPYRHVLTALQCMDTEHFPMSDYIVHVQTEIKPPAYLTHETEYILPVVGKEKSIPVLDTEQWPGYEDLGLDDSQYEAYKHALTKEFALIQGPPGTGKSFIGLQIVKTLLGNLSLSGTPILVICYTNHALDQFLENILKVTTDIVRLGGQSKSEDLEPYTLKALRARSRSKHSYVFNAKVKQQEEIVKRMMEVQSDIEKCDEEILSYNLVKPYLKIGNRLYDLDFCHSQEDPVSKWLFSHLQRKTPSKCENKTGVARNQRETKKQDEDAENILDNWDDEATESYEPLKVESCFSESWALKEIESMRENIRQTCNLTSDKQHLDQLVETFEERIEYTQRKLAFFKSNLREDRKKMYQQIPRKAVRSLNELSVDERWSLYFEAANMVREQCLASMTLLERKHTACSAAVQQLGTLLDAELVGAARVLGATTTLAARRRDMLAALRTPIVIVEEAAEVLEAHIVAALTPHCQHLILIGDHKQLRPGTAAHASRSRRLDVSLPERAALSGLAGRRLATQRRMRPRLLALISPHVYPDLGSHGSVLRLPHVRGVHGDLFFLDHRHEEEECGERSHSYKNVWEARWVVALAAHLRRKHYALGDVVLLAAYAGQAELIAQMCSLEPLLAGVRVAAVDSYQGEESRIVLLSLVRCNRDRDIGFLADDNRTCVALSRAKEGLYMFGDMSGLRERSALWRRVEETLRSDGAIGERLALSCPYHPQHSVQVASPEEVNTGGCGAKCGAPLPCGHRCDAACHKHEQHTTCCQHCDSVVGLVISAAGLGICPYPG